MKKAIIIGASSGIGRELARILVSNNYVVGITGRRAPLLEALKTEKPANYRVKVFDVCDTNIMPEKLTELATELGGLDLLVISAGTGDLNKNLDFDVEKRAIDTNVSGFTCAADWAFNYFKQQKSGHLVAISSIAGLRGNGIAPAYNAGKAYQINYMEGLRQKARKLGLHIRITDVRPGFVDTEMAKGEGQFWVAPVEKAARQIFEAIQSGKKVVYISKRWRLIGGLLKLLPRSLYERM